MRLLRGALCTVTLATLNWSPLVARGKDFVAAMAQEADPAGVKYKPARLPLSAKSASTWIILRELMVKPLPDKTPLRDVIRSLNDAMRSKHEQGSPPRIYVDPTSLLESAISMATPIRNPFVGVDSVPLHVYLGAILKPFGLAHRVHDSLVVIDSPCDDCPPPVEVSAAEAWSWLLLHEDVEIRFPKETPLVDVVETIQRATVGKGPRGRGLVIHLDPAGLRAARKAPDSTVTFEMDGVPLCTSLSLILKQLGLGFHVRDDGVVVVTESTVSQEPLEMDEFHVIESYQTFLYTWFWENHRNPAKPNGDDRQSPLQKRPRRPKVSDRPE